MEVLFIRSSKHYISDSSHDLLAYIEGLSLASSPAKIEVGNAGMWKNDSIAFLTEEGRYGYLCGHPYGADSIQVYSNVYSLYDGLGQ